MSEKIKLSEIHIETINHMTPKVWVELQREATCSLCSCFTRSGVCSNQGVHLADHHGRKMSSTYSIKLVNKVSLVSLLGIEFFLAGLIGQTFVDNNI
jgi:hypothetical protein